MTDSFIINDEDMEQSSSSVPQFREVVYEKLWIIPDWNRIQQTRQEVEAKSIEFLTGKSTGPQTKWKLGFKFCNLATNFYLYLKLIGAKGFYEDSKVQVSTNRWILKQSTDVHLNTTPMNVVSLGDELEIPKVSLCFDSERWVSESWINSNGEVTFKVKLVIMEPEIRSSDLTTELFNKASFVEVRNNFASLVGDQASADMKIITSDEKEVFAHKAILKVQCPVFESMFRSDLSENKSGEVNVKDVNGKTMGIFLHLFYTGELLPSWRDDDTVVGFTYAVGKYQLVNVLKFLDEVLGSRDEEESFQRDVQLLDLTRKLDLKTAEKELLARLKRTMDKVKSGDEFFDLYAW